jgi:zinc protease
MTPRVLVLAAALLAVAPAGEAQQSAATEFTTAGIRVLFKPVPANDVIAVRLYLRGGSANLNLLNAGIEEFAGELARRGTERYTADTFAARAARTGSVIGAAAGYDFTVFTLRAVRDFWDEAWDLFTQAALHPTYPDDELALVRSQLLNALRQRSDDPDQQLSHLADSAFYAGNTYALDPEGTEAALLMLRRDDLLRWHRERFSKENLLLVVVGNVDRADLEAKIAAAFGTLPARGGAARQPGPYVARHADVLAVSRQLPTNYVEGMFAAPARSDADDAALRLCISILSDRLFEEVRTKRNLSYAVYAALNSNRVNAGFLYVTAIELDTTLKVMRHEVERLGTEPIARDLLGETVNQYLTAYLTRQEANASQANMLGMFELAGGGWRRAESFPERVRAVTPADVQRVARRYLRNLRFVVVGDSTKVDRRLFTSF